VIGGILFPSGLQNAAAHHERRTSSSNQKHLISGWCAINRPPFRRVEQFKEFGAPDSNAAKLHRTLSQFRAALWG
jgi:hypothetical protein